QIGGQPVCRLVFAQAQVGHGVVGGVKRQLEVGVNGQAPVKEIGVVTAATVIFHPGNTFFHHLSNLYRIIDNNLVAFLRHAAQRTANKAVDVAQVGFSFLRAG